jgi:hypothetical protein
MFLESTVAKVKYETPGGRWVCCVIRPELYYLYECLPKTASFRSSYFHIEAERTIESWIRAQPGGRMKITYRDLTIKVIHGVELPDIQEHAEHAERLDSSTCPQQSDILRV